MNEAEAIEYGILFNGLMALRDKVKALEEENARLKEFNKDLHYQLSQYRAHVFGKPLPIIGPIDEDGNPE